MISRIHSATVAVVDQQAAVDFYTQKLGWSVSIDAPMGDSRFVTVVPPNGKTELALVDAKVFGQEPGGFTGISLLSDDIEGDFATLSERGVKFKEPLAPMPWGAQATWFYDVDGNELFLSEDQG